MTSNPTRTWRGTLLGVLIVLSPFAACSSPTGERDDIRRLVSITPTQAQPGEQILLVTSGVVTNAVQVRFGNVIVSGHPQGPDFWRATVPNLPNQVWPVQVVVDKFSSNFLKFSVLPPKFEVSIPGDNYYTNDTIFAVTSGIESDALIFQWFVNGVPVGGTLSFLNGSQFTRGDQVYVEVRRPNNKVVHPHRSNVVTIRNSPPQILWLLATPPPWKIKSGDSIEVSGQARDPDFDPINIKYLWIVNGHPVAVGPNLPAGVLHRDDAVVVKAIPNDGFTDGDPVEMSLPVGNSAPTAVTVTVSIPEAVTAPIRAIVGGWFDRDGDPPMCYCVWYINGKEVPNQSGDTLPRELAGRGYSVQVTYYPTDHIAGPSTKIVSAASVAPNASPKAPYVTLAPADAYLGAGAIWAEFPIPATDVDGDPIYYTYAWTKNGIPQAFPDDQTIVTAPFANVDDEWELAVTAHDAYSASESAQTVRPAAIQAIGVAVGSMHSCALSKTRRVYCWGNNYTGELGTPLGLKTFEEFSPVPQPVSKMPRGAKSIFASDLGTCTLMETGEVYCWGAMYDLGPDTYTPVLIQGMAPLKLVAGGGFHSCGVTFTNAVYCWGGNHNWGGDGLTEKVKLAASFGETIVDIATGASQVCVLTASGSVLCWGSRNQFGQLGNGTTTPNLFPVAVTLPAAATSIDAGGFSTCAVLSGGSTYCWGRTIVNGIEQSLTLPTQMWFPTAAASVVVGFRSRCTLTIDGVVSCGGANGSAELGQGHIDPVSNAATIPTLTQGVSAISVYYAHVCALAQSGAVYCLGENPMGQLGNGTTDIGLVPTPIIGVIGD